MNDIRDFIKEENLKLYNLQTGLSATQRARLLPKIRNIRFLLTLLQNENLSKKQTDDLEKKIEETTDKLEDDTKKQQIQQINTLSIVKKIKPNISSIDDEVKKKALMVKASGDYETLPDAELTNSFLQDNDINYSIDPELSTKESLVLINNENPNDIKVAYRGSKMNNLKDWVSNGKILLGKEKSNSTFEDSFNDASNQIEDIKTKYGTLPNELLGYSRGGSLAISTGDKFGINTTSFNSFVGRNILKSRETASKHTLYRTTEDIPSLALGFKADLKNFDVKTIRPLVDSVNPRQAHALKNFTERGQRASDNDPDLLENRMEKIYKAGKMHGEAQSIADAANMVEGKPFMPISKDLYNINAKIKKNNEDEPLLGHSVDDDLYEIGEQVNRKTDKMISDTQSFQSEIDDFMRDINLQNKQSILNKLQLPEELDDDFFTDLERQERANTKRQIRLSRQAEMETRTEAPSLDSDRSNVFASDRKRTLTDYVREISPADVVVDENNNERLSNRIHGNSTFLNVWDEAGGEYTDSELKHINSINLKDVPDHKFNLTKEQRDEIYNATPEERVDIVKRYEQNAHDIIKENDTYTSIPVGDDLPPRTISGDIVSGLNPSNLLVGIAASKASNALIDQIDPDLPVVPRSAISGGLAGAGTEAAILGLSGLGAGISATALLPAAAVGAASSLSALGSEELLTKAGVKSQAVKSTVSGGVGGAVAGVGSVIGGSALLGAEAALPFDAATFGTASLVGAGIGSIIGLAGYGLGKLGINI